MGVLYKLKLIKKEKKEERARKRVALSLSFSLSIALSLLNCSLSHHPLISFWVNFTSYPNLLKPPDLPQPFIKLVRSNPAAYMAISESTVHRRGDHGGG